MTNPNDPALKPFWADLGIHHNDLGCIMLDLDLRAIKWLPGLLEEMREDAYVPNDPKVAPWIGGIEERHHVTVLYGLTVDPNEHSEAINLLFAHDGAYANAFQYGVGITDVEAFPSNIPGEDYACIVLRCPSSYLTRLNEAAKLIPHVDTWPSYKPHITLGYVKARTAPYWSERIYKMFTSTPTAAAKVTGLNLGKEKPWLKTA